MMLSFFNVIFFYELRAVYCFEKLNKQVKELAFFFSPLSLGAEEEDIWKLQK